MITTRIYYLYSEILKAIGPSTDVELLEIGSLCRGTDLLYRAYQYERERRERFRSFTEERLKKIRTLCLLCKEFYDHFEDIPIQELCIGEKLERKLLEGDVRSIIDLVELLDPDSKKEIQGIGVCKKQTMQESLYNYVIQNYNLCDLRTTKASYCLVKDGDKYIVEVTTTCKVAKGENVINEN